MGAMIALCSLETPRASESPRRTIRIPGGENLVVGSFEAGAQTPVLDEVANAIDWNLWEITPTNTPLRQTVLGQAEAPLDTPDNRMWEMPASQKNLASQNNP